MSDLSIAKDDSLTSAQAGARLGVSTQTIQKWVDAGALRAWRTVGGHRRVDLASVEKMLRERSTLGPPPGTPPPARTPSVMLVEDDPDAAAILHAQILRLLPEARIRVMHDGFTALLEAGRELPDLLVTDINLPGMDGIAMVRSLRAHPGASNLRVVMVTHHSPQELHQFGAVPAGVPVLRKPARLDDLRQALGLVTATP
jgi:excisionase family DNA binding protein